MPLPKAPPFAAPSVASRALFDTPKPTIHGDAAVTLRKPGALRPLVLAIGTSTGGPQALFKLLGEIAADIDLPIVITQHMPATFTTILAEHISKVMGRPCHEGSNGALVKQGSVYLAPGDYHMTVEVEGANKVIRLNQGPPENFCRPAVDPMFRSVSKAYGAACLGVVLTGMGHDGLEGGRLMVETGGSLIAQDEESSVVWGMPGAVAAGGLCSAVLPLDDIPSHLIEVIGGTAK